MVECFVLATEHRLKSAASERAVPPPKESVAVRPQQQSPRRPSENHRPFSTEYVEKGDKTPTEKR